MLMPLPLMLLGGCAGSDEPNQPQSPRTQLMQESSAGAIPPDAYSIGYPVGYPPGHGVDCLAFSEQCLRICAGDELCIGVCSELVERCASHSADQPDCPPGYPPDLVPVPDVDAARLCRTALQIELACEDVWSSCAAQCRGLEGEDLFACEDMCAMVAEMTCFAPQQCDLLPDLCHDACAEHLEEGECEELCSTGAELCNYVRSPEYVCCFVWREWCAYGSEPHFMCGEGLAACLSDGCYAMVDACFDWCAAGFDFDGRWGCPGMCLDLEYSCHVYDGGFPGWPRIPADVGGDGDA